ncbi:transglutaminaseTgpA domain-containing protein [Actinokineospora guangxiensis]|uniref:TransglutaminaseTgpA domain-containing protein n=1 Tax=Actinokineospora guangxiensis TaxID=1490288 RepID=A0ABW0EMQ9_9PSEU
MPLAQGWSGLLALGLLVAAVVLAHVLVAAAGRFPAGSVLTVLIPAGLAGGYFAARGAIEGGPMEVLRDSVPRLLTAARPAPPTVDLLMPGVVFVFCVAVVAAVSLRGTRLLGPPLAAVALYASGALLTGGSADPYGLAAVGVVAIALAGWVRRSEAPAVLGAVVGLVAVVLPAGDAFEPRELVQPPIADVQVANPLPRLAAWAAAPDTELLRLRGPQHAVRLAVLSKYTGASWRAATLYGPLGAVDAPALPPGGRVEGVSVEITVGALDGTWLPGMGRTVSTSLSDALVDPDSGALVLPRGLTPGLRYTVDGILDQPTDEQLAGAGVPGGAPVEEYLELPRLPADLAEYARTSVKSATNPYEQAVALEQVVRLDRVPDAEAPTGSSYARISQFLFGAPGTNGAGEGTAEQFATAYAVLARAVGLPTRVVVGFPPVPEGPDGYRVLRGVDVTAWPEVYFQGWGWVPFDPVSGTDSGPSAAAKREVLDRLASVTASPPTPPSDLPPLLPPPHAPPPQAAAEPPSRVWVVATGIALLPVLAAAVLATLRLARRSRLRRSGATGAWRHVLDQLVVSGRTPAPHLTAPAIAATIPDPAAHTLATLADRAAFAPYPPSPAATDPWTLARRARTAVARKAPWYRRLLWPIDPRPLRHR